MIIERGSNKTSIGVGMGDTGEESDKLTTVFEVGSYCQKIVDEPKSHSKKLHP